jgi:uncharacterized membrane protein
MALVSALSIWLHISAVVVAVGSTFFLLYVLRPALAASLRPAELHRVLGQALARYRVIMWAAIGFIAVTGFYTAIVGRGWSPATTLASTFDALLTLKIVLALILFANVFLVTIPSARLGWFRSHMPDVARLNLLIALIIILIASVIARVQF